MFLRLLAMAVLFGGVAIGCAGPRYVALDSGPSDAASPTGTLMLVSSSSLTLRPSQTATIDVRFTDASGAPRAGVVIAAAIEGTALDSTLGALTATTDATGLAHATLVAGSEAATFRVRLSTHEAAAAVYIDVGVGTSFGALVVHAPYTGTRPVTHRIVDVVPGMTCHALEAMPPASGGRTVTSTTDDVTVMALPTTLTYAVLVRAEGALATEAMGCTEGVVPRADLSTTVNVPLTEVPLGLDGNYTVSTALHAGGTIAGRIADWATSLRAASASRGGDATLLLDAIEAELVRAGASSDALTLHTLRATEPIDATLAAQLTTDGSAPTELVASLLDAAGPALDAPTVSLGLVLGTTDAMTTQSLACSDGMTGTVTLASATPMARAISRTATIDTTWTMTGPIDAPVGSLAMAWIDAVASERAHVHDVAELMTAACASLETYAATTQGANALSACDGGCRASACASALADIRALVADDAAAADHDIAGARIDASITTWDDDGDARVDRLDGTLHGSLVDATGATVGTADGVSGTMAGTRAAIP